MNGLQKMGGVAALIMAATFVWASRCFSPCWSPLDTLPQTSILFRMRLSSRTTKP